MEQDNDKLTGTTRVYETYIGGRAKQAYKYKNKTGVYGVTERGGQAKVVVAHGRVSATTAIPFLKANIELGFLDTTIGCTYLSWSFGTGSEAFLISPLNSFLLISYIILGQEKSPYRGS